MKKLLLIVGLLLCSCESPEDQKARFDNHDVAVLSSFCRYYKDTRTNLCFAGMDVGGYSATLTNVPCSPEVDQAALRFYSNPK